MTLYKPNGEVLKKVRLLEPPPGSEVIIGRSYLQCLDCPPLSYPVEGWWHRLVRGHWPRRQRG